MSCEHWRKQIALYVEGDVSPRKSRQVGEHVGNCPDCRRFAQELTQTQAVLRSLRHEAIDGRVFETIQDRVMEQLASSQVSVSHGWPRSIAWRWTVTGFVALLVFVGGAIWKRSSHRMSTEIVETGKPEGRIATRPGTKTPETVASQTQSEVLKSSRALIENRKLVEANPPEHHGLTSGSRRQVNEQDSSSEHLEANAPSGRAGESLFLARDRPAGIQGDQPSMISESDPLVIKLVTDDPEVVIVWLVDPDRGQRQ